MTPRLVVIAGPNGAGKSTYYEVFLAESPLAFLDADLLAAETGLDSLEAARVLDVTRGRMIEDGLGFITETVFSDPYGTKLQLLAGAVAAGFEVRLIYVGISSAELAARRVDQRVASGGHDVPRDRIASRFDRSLDNLRQAIRFVPTVELYDNSDFAEPYRHVARLIAGSVTWRMQGAVPRWARDMIPAGPRRRRPR